MSERWGELDLWALHGPRTRLSPQGTVADGGMGLARVWAGASPWAPTGALRARPGVSLPPHMGSMETSLGERLLVSSDLPQTTHLCLQVLPQGNFLKVETLLSGGPTAPGSWWEGVGASAAGRPGPDPLSSSGFDDHGSVPWLWENVFLCPLADGTRSRATRPTCST